MAWEIERFVKGNLQIGKQKFYDSKENGGLGLFKIEDFLTSQVCAWVKRSYNQDELWKKELLFYSNGTVFNLRKGGFNKVTNPILTHIAASFEKFSLKFTVHNENFLKMFLYENPILNFDPNNQNFLKKEFFPENIFQEHQRSIKLLTMENLLYENKTFKTKEDFERETGITGLCEIKFARLVGLARTALNRFSKTANNEKSIDTLQNFCMRIRKGSKKFRKIIVGGTVLAISKNMQRFRI